MAGTFRVMTLLGAVAIGALDTHPLTAQADSVRRPVVETSATGEVTAQPDYAVVLISVLARDGSAAGASQRNAAKARALIDSLKAHGVSPDSLPTAGYSVAPEYEQGRQSLKSYLARSTVRLTLRDLSKLGVLIDAALNAGADQVPSIAFAVTNSEALRREAIATAVRDARGQAESAATAAGGHLGRMIHLSVSAGPRPYSPGATQLSELRVSGPTPITPPGVVSTAFVSVSWEFVEGH